MTDYGLWQNRYLAADLAIKDLLEYLKNSKNEEEKNKLTPLIESLRCFARGQFYFFWNGFQNEE
ncbi:MAG: hypothetical protein R3264_01725, partial [Anaerolineae bacterium]|nr:hypothetical protein [Anaerolineae bacterium]